MPLPDHQFIALRPADEVDVFVKLQCQSRTIMLLFGIKYSMSDVFWDVNYCARGAKLRNTAYSVNNVSASSFIIWLS